MRGTWITNLFQNFAGPAKAPAQNGPSTEEALHQIPDGLLDEIRRFKNEWLSSVVKSARPPGLIYHYCDATALLGIFRTKSLWATGARYLNDTLELVAILKDLPSALTAQHTPAMKEAVNLTDVMRTTGADMISNGIGGETYVACFSEDPDILSQWRAYADDGLGFAVGFNPERLRVLRTPNPHAAPFYRILYAGQQEQQMVDNLLKGFARRIEPYLDMLDTSGWNHEYGKTTFREWCSLRLSECLLELSIRCKHRSFREEKEWRIVAPGGETQFRTSRGRLVPYVLLDMASFDSAELSPSST